MKLKKGDQVKILIGKDAGQIGKIEAIDTKDYKATVAGKNIYKRHLKPRNEGDHKSGGIIAIPRPVSLSKLMLICPKCQKGIRVAYRISGGEKKRICRLCQAEI